MKKYKDINIINVSAGHNVYIGKNFDPGAVCEPYVEADITKETVKILIPILESQGYIVNDVTPYNEKFEYKKDHHIKRCNQVDKDKADLYLDIHINAGGGKGVEAWVYSMNSKSVPYAKKICENISNDMGLNNRGVKANKNYWSVSLCKAPAIIVEGAFIDNKSDMEKLTPKKYAISIAKCFGEIKQVAPRKLYTVQAGAYSIKENAEDMLKRLEDINIKGFIKEIEIVANEDTSENIQEPSKPKEVINLKHNDLVKNGSRGEHVKELQQALNKIGYNVGTADGIAGVKTISAIKNLQRDYKITVDGIAGQATYNLINKLLNNKDLVIKKPSDYRFGAAYVIEVEPSNLYVDVVKKANNKIVGDFINGSLYDMGTMKSISTLVSNGKVLAEHLPHDNVKRGTFVVWKNGKVTTEMIDFISKYPKLKDVKFAIGGFDIMPNIPIREQFKKEWFNYNTVGYRTWRSMIGYSKLKNKALIVISPNIDAEQGQALMKKLGCDCAIGLDSGLSTSGRFNGNTIRTTTRKVHNIIRWN